MWGLRHMLRGWGARAPGHTDPCLVLGPVLSAAEQLLLSHTCHVPRTMPGTHWDPHGSCSREVRRQVGKRQNKDIIGAGREKSTRRGTRTSSHEEPVWMQPLASAGYLLAQHSHALEGDSPRPALPPRARQKLRAPKSRGDPPDSWQPANCICNPSLCGYKNAGSHLKRTH